MGIPTPLVELLLFESKDEPLGEKALSLGKQTVICHEKQLKQLAERQQFALRDTTYTYDKSTVTSQQNTDQAYIEDTAFWDAIGVGQLDVMDVSDYEGATIVADLCEPVEASLYGKYDFIYNGSVLDNIFDPVTALVNTSQMLAPGGTVVHIEMSSHLCFEYISYSPDWFYDYYAVNNFEDCKVYVCCFNSTDQLLNGPWDVYGFMPSKTGEVAQIPSLGPCKSAVVTIARKGYKSTNTRKPIQWSYRPEEQNKEILAARERFISSPRPFLGVTQECFVNEGWEGFLHCGQVGGN